MDLSLYKPLRYSYGFDEVAIVPGDITINPEQIDIAFHFGEMEFPTPILASAMDAVTDPRFAIALGKVGGLAVMNLEGVQTKYEDPDEVLDRIVHASESEVTGLMQKVYSAPVKDNLIGDRIAAIKKGGVICAASVTPNNAKRIGPIAAEAGVDILVVQATVTTVRHRSKSYHGLLFSELCDMIKVPIIVGNCVTYSAALQLMETGIAGLLVGVGPGAACTTREVTGVGVPQVTGTMDCAAAREAHFRATGRYVAIITDGGIRTGGDICKSLAAGADAVMIGSPFAQTKEAPGRGYNWGMATPHPALPRGTRIKVGTNTTLQQLLFGPSSRTDGTQNLTGAIRVCLGMVGASTLKEMHNAELIVAPSIKTEGKIWQMARG
ncbi:MAG: GuaB3 family IMP dehydrogenase-related protein [Chloroflexi bacterium]|nr:GuaB3 family IMP dehydrogenase-related protein [Chloroflexota bacterium]